MRLMKFFIRRAKYGDAAGIARVHVESWKSTYRGIVPDAALASLDVDKRARNWEEHLLSGAHSIYVAQDESEIIGFAAGGAIRETFGDYDAELYALYSLFTRQRQGIGRRLVQALAQDLRARGFQSMLLWVLEQNPAVGFYERLGGIQVAQAFVEMGGVPLPELAFGWRILDRLAEPVCRPD